MQVSDPLLEERVWFAGATLDDGTLLLGAANAVLRSTDDGASWSANTTLWAKSFAALGETVVAAAGREIWRSEDGGVTWTPLNWPHQQHILDLAFAAERLLAGTGGIGVLYSTDMGATWHPTGLANEWSNEVEAHNDLVLAGSLFGEMAVSQDGGLTWLDAGAGEIHTDAIVVDSEGRFIVGDVDRVLVTADGEAWTQGPRVHASIRDLATVSGLIAVATDGGVMAVSGDLSSARRVGLPVAWVPALAVVGAAAGQDLLLAAVVSPLRHGSVALWHPVSNDWDFAELATFVADVILPTPDGLLVGGREVDEGGLGSLFRMSATDPLEIEEVLLRAGDVASIARTSERYYAAVASSQAGGEGLYSAPETGGPWTREPIPGALRSVAAGGDGAVWAGGDEAVHRLQDGLWQSIELPGSVVALTAYDRGVLAANATGVVVYIAGSTRQVRSMDTGVQGREVRGFVTDSRERILAFTSDGVWGLNSTTSRWVDVSGALPYRDLLSAAVGHDGAVYVGTAGHGVLVGR